jgi:hypothetical protein
VILFILAACRQEIPPEPEPTLSNVPVEIGPTPTQKIVEVTPSPTQMLSTPEPIPTPESFDPLNPFLFVNGQDSIILKDGVYTEIGIDGVGFSWFTPEIWMGGDLLSQLGKCDRKAVLANTYDGEKLVTHKIVIYVHSGISGCGQDNATNFIRVFLEGKDRKSPNILERPNKLVELARLGLYLKQITGKIDFNIDDAVVIPAKDWFTGCDENDRICRGSMERFFDDPKPGVREEFVVFCSAEKIDDQTSKFILRLTPITDGSEP